ncbi:MAG: hypothetical protein WBP59_05620, partial [Ilumatobacteraceae bacterium]
MGRIRTTSALFITLVALGVSACGTDNDSSSTSMDSGDDMEFEAPSSEARSGEGAIDESGDTDGAVATAGSSAPAAPLGLDTLGRAIAIDAGVRIGTPNIRDAV